MARIYFKTKSNQHRKQSPRAPPSRQVEVLANNLSTCQVNFFIDDLKQNQSPSISTKTTIQSWESWDTISIPRMTLENCRRRVNELKQKAEARAEAELWAKVARARFGARQKIEPNQGIEPEPEMETAALATESGELDWISDILNHLDSALEREKTSFNSIAAKTDEVLENTEEAYDKDGANELSEDKLRTAVLNGTDPTGITNAGASASC